MTGAASGSAPMTRPSISGRPAAWATRPAADRTAGSSAVPASRTAAWTRASAAVTR